ncbi:MAG: glycine betaine ABC transporter substrate-binding protein, partial [Casimicrobiaceae bacterium]
MHAMLSRIAAGAVALVVMVGIAIAQTSSPVRVASKIDTEGSLLGHMIVAVLEAKGIKTENKLQLGTTKIVRGAITAGEIDIYPEYTGNGAFFFSDEKNLAWKNAKAGFERVKSLDAEKNKIVWLEPAPANNTWAIAVRKDVATAHGLKSLADLG